MIIVRKKEAGMVVTGMDELAGAAGTSELFRPPAMIVLKNGATILIVSDRLTATAKNSKKAGAAIVTGSQILLKSNATANEGIFLTAEERQIPGVGGRNLSGAAPTIQSPI